MTLIEIARTPRSAPEGEGGASGGGAPPAAGAGGAAAGAAGAAAAGASGSVLGGAAAVAEKKPDDAAAAAAAGAGDAAKGKDGEQGAGSAEAKAKEGAKPVELEVKLPDGVKVDEKTLGEFKGVATEAKLSSEQASFLAAWYVKRQQSEVAGWQDTGKKWGEALKADKDFGGENFAESSAAAQKAVLQFGGKDLANALEKYGIGNMPELAKAFAKIGRALKDDSTQVAVVGEGGAKKPLTGSQRVSKMYDSPDAKRARGEK